jgi:hypothetical protein
MSQALVGVSMEPKLRFACAPLSSSGEFYDYWEFHEILEYERNHANLYAGLQVPSFTQPNQSSPHRSKAKLKIVKK